MVFATRCPCALVCLDEFRTGSVSLEGRDSSKWGWRRGWTFLLLPSGVCLKRQINNIVIISSSGASSASGSSSASNRRNISFNNNDIAD